MSFRCWTSLKENALLYGSIGAVAIIGALVVSLFAHHSHIVLIGERCSMGNNAAVQGLKRRVGGQAQANSTPYYMHVFHSRETGRRRGDFLLEQGENCCQSDG